MTEPLMTISDVAAYLVVSEHTLYYWRCKNIGPPSIRVGRHVRYRRDAVDAWLEQQTAPSPLPPRKIRKAKAEA